MNRFVAKTYQQQVLDSVESYFKACHELPSPSIAFTATTERLWGRGLPYHPLSDFPADMPYFCLRVPTGGGKTWLAAKSVQRINTHLLRCEHSVILWLVPSKPICVAQRLRRRVEGGADRTAKFASPLLGVFEGRAIYLLYNGILKDKSVAGGNVLTGPVFEALPTFAGPKVPCTAANRMGARAAREGISFKQTPYALEI